MFWWALACVIALGAFEGIFGRVRYAGDAICYLDVARALHAQHWKLALNSYWSLGYPLLLSPFTLPFQNNPLLEWVAIHIVNVGILIATYCAFHSLVLVASRTLRPAGADSENRYRLIFLSTLTVFLSVELSMDNVSRVGPDMLVACMVFASAAWLLRLQQQPSPRDAAWLGIFLGLGYIVKAIFLPLTVLFIVVELLVLRKTGKVIRYAAITSACAALFVIPYVAGISWSLGRLTFGESGPLNYAINVNGLPNGGLWLDYPSEFGAPVHPIKVDVPNTTLLLFGDLFPVSYPPFFNEPYYYEGYRHLISWKNQLRSIGVNLLRTGKALVTQGILYALFLGWWLYARSRQNSRFVEQIIRLWPLGMIACGGISIYLMVYVAPRYISSFCCLLLLMVLFGLLACYPESTAGGRKPSNALLAILVAGCACTLIATQNDGERDILGHIRRGEMFFNYDQWKAASYLKQIGLQPGDRVAVAADAVNSERCTWAYLNDLHIVGQLATNLPDFQKFMRSSPAEQQRTLEVLHKAGVRLVFSIYKPEGVDTLGWEQVPATDLWIYRFPA